MEINWVNSDQLKSITDELANRRTACESYQKRIDELEADLAAAREGRDDGR